MRVFALSIFAGIDVWRVPSEWGKRKLGDVIRGISNGEHKELAP